MTVRRSFLLILASLPLLVVPLVALAETKILTAETAYTMGDGETPSFAEAMVLQKAKQMALEQAGTYVESYTKVQNLDLTVEEIQTIAGGVLQVEVLEKKRSLVGDGLQIYVRIKATVTTDKMEELAQRIKGKNVAEEYKKLQGDYAKLTKELETWKQLVAKTPSGPEREAALDQIREHEKAFSAVQNSEAVFFRRLVSGEALVKQAEDEKAIVDALFRKIVEQGHRISMGEPTSHRAKGDHDKVRLRIPVTIEANNTIRRAVEETARSLGGNVISDRFVRELRGQGRETGAAVIAIGRDVETARYFQEQVGSLAFIIRVELANGEAWVCNDWKENGDQRSPFYLETNPIASVSLFYTRFFESGVGPLGLRDIADYWRHNSDASTRWVSDHAVLIAGSLDPISPFIFGKNTLNKDHHGLVVVFDDVRSFTVTTIIPIAQARQVKAIRGELVEKVAAPSSPSVKAAAVSKSSVKGERSWWERLFGIDEEKSELPDRQEVARQPSPPIPKQLSRAIEQ